MKFEWKMDEDTWTAFNQDFEILKSDPEMESTEYSEKFNEYPVVQVGKVHVEFVMIYDDEPIHFPEFFILEEDTGYGKTENGEPYSLASNQFLPPYQCNTFAEFQKSMEEKLKEYFSSDSEYNWMELANSESGWKNLV